MLLSQIVSALATISLGINLWQFIAAWFFPLHRRIRAVEGGEENPGVTILKPLKGRDVHARSCLRSWMTVRYSGPVQILFGVREADDPIVELVEELLAEFPKADARVVVCPEMLGPNAKVSTLAQLEPLIEHPLVLVSDADVRVPAEFLTSAVRRLLQPGVGLITSFYRLANPTTLAMYWEAVAINADFWSQVLQSRVLGRMRFAMGAVMLTTRENLTKIGGFRSLVDYLADDYQLGNRIAKLPARVEVCPLVVECWDDRSTWRQIWSHQVRWARTIRVCQPWSFFASSISAVSVWSLVWFLLGDLPLVGFLGLIGYRMAQSGILALRLLGDSVNPCKPWKVGLMAPVKDFLGMAAWAVSFLGNKVAWRGQSFRVQGNGRMIAVGQT